MGSNEFGALGIGGGADGTRSGSGSARIRIAGDDPVGEPQVVDFDRVFSDSDASEPRTVCVRTLHAGPRHVVAQLVVTRFTSDGSSPYSQTVLVGWGASRHGQLGQNGGARCVVLHASGRLSALGSNKQGQIPSLSRERVCRLGCTWRGTYMQAIDGDKHVLLTTGNNAQGQLGRDYTEASASTVDVTVNLPLDRALSSFVCGSEHVLAVMSSSSQEGNSVVGWGWNEHGNMGLGSLGNIAIPTQLWPREDIEAYNKYPQRVIDIWAGCATSWLLVE
ncbi:regulator of chromosome condensation 1/beta-lactamase-inhibitor protein II [Boletus edulis]|nr:regulator of chromosome condensation 1/beta-lactamase-inhibitor protein II [Boletus edulis]